MVPKVVVPVFEARLIKTPVQYLQCRGKKRRGKVGQSTSLIRSRRPSQIDLSKTMARLLRNINPHSFNIGQLCCRFLYYCPSASHGRKVSPSSSEEEQRDTEGKRKDAPCRFIQTKRNNFFLWWKVLAFVMKTSGCTDITACTIIPFIFLLRWYFWAAFIKSANDPRNATSSPLVFLLNPLLWVWTTTGLGSWKKRFDDAPDSSRSRPDHYQEFSCSVASQPWPGLHHWLSGWLFGSGAGRLTN